jgi:hypothetical protein
MDGRCRTARAASCQRLTLVTLVTRKPSGCLLALDCWAQHLDLRLSLEFEVATVVCSAATVELTAGAIDEGHGQQAGNDEHGPTTEAGDGDGGENANGYCDTHELLVLLHQRLLDLSLH